MQNEFLYHSHMVQALLRDGRTVEGKASVDNLGENALQSIEIGGTAYGAEEIADIRYLGRLLDYNAASQTGLIDRYGFDGRDCPDSAEFASMVYREQEYRVSCHLEVRRSAIRAVDVKVLEKVHVLNEQILTAERAFYRFADGRWVMGLLESPGAEGEGLSILTDGQERIAFSRREVADITRIPEVNDIVTVKTAGASVQGIVSAVEEDRMLIIADMLPKRVYYRDMEELRYQGTVTEWWRIDGKYYYSSPFYLKDKAEEEAVCEKAAVSYVAGVNGKGWIAKDIKLAERAGEALQRPPLSRYGIILVVSNAGSPGPDDYGYIGPEYRSKACGSKNGNVRFKRKHIPFRYDYTRNIYVVRYSVWDTPDSDGYIRVERMELVEAVDYASVGIVRTDEEGRIEKVPMYRALPLRYEKRKVDVVRRGGVSSGILIAQEAEGVWLEKDGEAGAELIPYGEIEAVRIRGRVTMYNRPGAWTGESAGLIDNDIFFHISSVGDLERAMIREGALVSYELCNSYKGDNKLCGKNIEVVGETLDGYALGYQEGILTVAAAEEYEKDPQIAARHSIYMEDSASFPDLGRYDYRAVFVLRKNGDRRECISVRVGKEVPKQMEGYATELQGETVRIVPAGQYGAGEEGERFTLLNVQEVQAKLMKLKRYDFAVRYCIRGQDAAEVVSVGEAKEKIFYGYIDTYYNDRQFGYITPKEYYGKKTFVERLKDSVDVWCSLSVFENAPERLDTYQYTYYVRYTLDHSANNPKEPARTVVFLESCAKSQKVAPKQKKGAAAGAEQEAVSEEVPGLREGETFFYRSEGGELCRAEFACEEEGRLYGKDGQILDAEAGEGGIWRLGVLTGFDDDFQEGRLNEGVRFNFSVMESKTFNIAKAGKKSLLLAYRTEEGQVSYIEKVSQEMQGQIPWIQGTVTDVLEKGNGRVILMDGEIRHYVSVLTDGLVSRLAKNGSLTGKRIYLRQVACPVWSGQDGAEMMAVASEVHCEEEEVVIRYDAVLGRYMAKRDSVCYPEVKGSALVLGRLVGSSASIRFGPDETRLQLEAYLEQGEDCAQGEPEQEYEDAEQKPSMETIHSALGQHCLKQVDLRRMSLPKRTDLDAAGWPVDKKQAEELMESLCASIELPVANMIAAVAIGVHMGVWWVILSREDKRTVTIEKLLQRAFRQSVREIIGDANGRLGEYTYYMTVLLRVSKGAAKKCNYLYRLFSQDFDTRVAIGEERRIRTMPDTVYQNKYEAEDLKRLFGKECRQERVGDIVAHILSLDEESAEFLLDLKAIQRNLGLSQEILKFGAKIEGVMHAENAEKCLEDLRRIYQEDKRRFSGEISLYCGGEDVCRQCGDIFKKMLQRFCRLMCRDDRSRFQRFSDCCDMAAQSMTEGFGEQERALLDAYRDIGELEEEVREHPTQHAVEMLEAHELFRKVREEVLGRLDQLYQDEKNRPDIRCYSNEYEVPRERKSILFLVENGGGESTNRQAAQNLTLFFETMTEGVVITDGEVKLSGRDLQSGTGSQVLEVPIDLSDLEEDSFSIAWSAEYQYAVGFDGARIRSTERKEGAEPIHFQLLQKEIRIDKRRAANPYKAPAIGQPLTTGEMFFGRKTEFREIWDYIVSPEKELIPGRTVIVYGQKKCGKTSLINQIKNRLEEEEEIRSRAIIIDIDNILLKCGGPNSLSYFTLNFYCYIMSLFEDEIFDRHPDVEEMLEREGLEIPDLIREEAAAPVLFQRFFTGFRKLDQGKHKILLVMDEFTLFCTAITQKLPEHPEYQHLPDFIKMLSGMGFLQIIVGHAAMMRSLSQLGVINHTAEFAKKVEISAIKREDGRNLVQKPMEQCFGRDVYQTPLGKRAVEKLLDLSGCSPYVLMKLCDRMFRYFVENAEKSQLIEADVDTMVKAYLADGIDAETFDMLLTEDGDRALPDEEKPAYLYLKHIVRESIRSNNHDCDFSAVCDELGAPRSNEMREILLGRRVLSMGNGRIRLNMWLFAEFMKYKYGM